MSPDPQEGVVDTNGKVWGTQNLYVADDCVIPITVDNNTSAIAYAIGMIIGHKIASIYSSGKSCSSKKKSIHPMVSPSIW